MEKKAFYFDMTSCIGCKTCQIACKDKNDLDVGTLFRKVVSFETGAFPNVKIYHYSTSCNHCSNPKCVSGCPTGAMHIDSKDLTVQHDASKCVGCKYCIWNCPYDVPQFSVKTGVVSKCNMCQDLQEVGQNPACVDACIMRCLTIADIDDATQDENLTQNLPILPDSNITNPSVFVKAKPQAFDKNFNKQEY